MENLELLRLCHHRPVPAWGFADPPSWTHDTRELSGAFLCSSTPGRCLSACPTWPMAILLAVDPRSLDAPVWSAAPALHFPPG